MSILNNQLRIIYADKAEDLNKAPLFFGNLMRLTFNPSSYKESYRNRYSKFQGLHTLGSPSRYALSDPGEISLTLLFDGTGVNDFGFMHAILELVGTSSVKEQVKLFLKATTTPKGSVHEPNYLRLLWGNMDFPCKLKSVDINYKLFNRLGMPLRAELDCTFTRTMSDAAWKKLLNAQSPDVTHQRVLKAGETLPGLCKEIYGKEDYYLEVAQANQLNNFRDLQPGTRLVFPPLV